MRARAHAPPSGQWSHVPAVAAVIKSAYHLQCLGHFRLEIRPRNMPCRPGEPSRRRLKAVGIAALMLQISINPDVLRQH